MEGKGWLVMPDSVSRSLVSQSGVVHKRKKARPCATYSPVLIVKELREKDGFRTFCMVLYQSTRGDFVFDDLESQLSNDTRLLLFCDGLPENVRPVPRSLYVPGGEHSKSLL